MRYLNNRSTRLDKTATLALVGGESLLGREIRDLMSGHELGPGLRLIAGGSEEAGKLTEQGGEPALVGALDKESLKSARVVFLAGPAESTRKVLDLAPSGRLIDLTYAAEDRAAARLRAPMAEPAGYSVPAGSIDVIASAAATAIAITLGRLHALSPIKRSVAHIFEPASEHGAPALEELQRQTVGLLSFKGQPKEIFDAQLAFNLLPRYGEEAPVALEEAEQRIERHLATLLSVSSRAPMPSLRLIQAPVFHGYSISLWVEFGSNPGVAAMERVLDAGPVDLRTGDTGPPDVVSIAGQEGIAIGGVVLDRNNPQAAWMWIVADNLRLRAENAILVAQQLP